jgi:uncharacterized protein YbcC (UPF0753/DUF2309 family)
LALVVAGCAALGLELLGVYAGHNMVHFWHSGHMAFAGVSALIMLAYVGFGMYELWGTVAATAFMIAPLAYVSTGLGQVALDMQGDTKEEQKDKRAWRAQQLAAQERVQMAKIEADKAARVAEVQAQAAQAAHHASTVLAQPAPSQHECGQCGRTFGTSQALNAHKRFCFVRNDSVSQQDGA